MLQVGQTAPAFELPGAAGGTIETHSLEEYLDHGWAVVVVFYPFDFHPDCTDQLCLLEDAEALSMVNDTVLFGISTDSAYSHRAYAEQYRIDFPLLSDSDGSVAEAYGVLDDQRRDHRSVARFGLFVVDPGQEVQYAWVGDSADERPDLSAVENATNCHDDECELPEGKSYL